MILKKQFYDRAAVKDDIEDICRIFNSYWEPLLGMPKFTAEDICSGLTSPGFDMSSSTRVIMSRQNKCMVGCILVLDNISPPVHPVVQGCVHPDFEEQGIGEYLLHWAEKRAGQAVDRVPAGIRVSINLTALNTHKPTLNLFNKMNYLPVRHSYIMVAELDNRLHEVKLPAGIIIKTYREHNDLASIYRAADEAFQDHWGYTSADEDEGVAQWQYRNENDPDFDPSLWFLALDGNEIAAVALCTPTTGTDKEMGYITLLGVRRPWRRKGLALGMLYHVFDEFQYRGLKYAGLNVDAASLTGANKVYEKAGMIAVRNIVTYEKELRPGRELGTQYTEK